MPLFFFLQKLLLFRLSLVSSGQLEEFRLPHAHLNLNLAARGDCFFFKYCGWVQLAAASCGLVWFEPWSECCRIWLYINLLNSQDTKQFTNLHLNRLDIFRKASPLAQKIKNLTLCCCQQWKYLPHFLCNNHQKNLQCLHTSR